MSLLAIITCCVMVITLKSSVDVTVAGFIEKSERNISEQIYFRDKVLTGAVQELRWAVERLSTAMLR